MAKVFISHSLKDNDIARKIAQHLQDDGVDAWIDYTRLKPGEGLQARIGEVLEWCDTLVLVWSKNAANSYYVNLEWHSALDMQKRIIPCVIDDSKRTPILHGFLDIDFKNFAAGYQQLLTTLDITRIKKAEPAKMPALVLKPKETIIKGIKMVLIPAGTFDMGDITGDDFIDEWPVHSVSITDFYLSQTEVTVGQFRRFVEANNYHTDAEKEGWAYTRTGSKWEKVKDTSWRKPGFSQTDDHPVVCVSWYDAVEFCKWAGCRLPTEAEWEYACRAGTTTPFNTGDNLSTDQANYNGNYRYNNYPKGKYIGKTTPVASYPPNSWKLYDMHGNVREWCQDWYGEIYYDDCKMQGTIENPTGPADGSARVIRGGSWLSYVGYCLSADRHDIEPQNSVSDIGFRPVYVPQLNL